MNKQLEEDIKIVEEFIEDYKIAEEVVDGNFIDSLETILSMLKEKDKKLEKKDKIIDEMVKVIIDSSICNYFIKQNCKHYAGENKLTCDTCIKQYFEKIVEKV